MRKTREKLAKLLQQAHDTARTNIPAGAIINQVRGSSLPPTGNTGTGYTPGDLSVETTKIADDAVTFAKMQNISTDRLIGRDTAGTGDPEQLTVTGGVEFTGSGGIQRSALTGDVTASAGGTSTTIANDAVTYAKMQNVSAASKLIGRGDSGSGDPEEITLGTGLSMTGTTLSSSGGGSSLTVEEVDGSPTDSAVTKIVFPNGTLGIASHIATYTPAAVTSDHNHTSTGGDGGVLTNDEHDGFSEYAEISAPSTPASNKARLYAKDKSGVTELYYKNDAGTERDLSVSTNAVYPTTAAIWWHEFQPVSTSTALSALAANATAAYNYESFGGGTNGDAYETTFMLKAGTYTVKTTGLQVNNRGLLDYAIDGSTVITGQDWYTASGTASIANKSASSITVSGNGRHVLRITVNGKNGSSSNYFVSLQKIWFVPASFSSETV